MPQETKLMPCPACFKQPFEYKPGHCWCENVDCFLYAFAFDAKKWNTRVTSPTSPDWIKEAAEDFTKGDYPLTPRNNF